METQQIIIDTDPGQDDAVAILLALASPELQVLGLTCVAGNVALNLTTLNARKICELAGRADIPVYGGCDRPMGRALITAEHVHGHSGMDGPDLPLPDMPLQPVHAVGFLIDTLRSAPPKTITLCPLGPLTNIATAFARAPDIVTRVRQIVLMGGSHFKAGNVTPAAEFNIHVDPDAAAMVFASGVALTVVPLDVTHKALVTPARNAAFNAIGTAVGRAVAQLTAFADRYDSTKYGAPGAPLHDPCVIAWLLAPHLFSGRQINVEIETSSELTMGMTVADWWGVTDRSANALFLGDVDAEALFNLMTERLARL
ncbi:nucleoside hydrolase [Roseovarius aestuarii]|nr:nucleoside hydrolase [Roseovarius aestuarii]